MRKSTTSWVRQAERCLPWRTLLLVLLSLAAWLLPGAAPELWVFDRMAVLDGEYWRLLTAHWVHSDPEHAIWNIGALSLMGLMFERQLGGRLPLALVAGMVGVDIWLWWLQPELVYYCGLSGILNSLLAVALLRLLSSTPHPVVWLTAIGCLLKVALELQTGQALFTSSAWESVPGAHAAGLASGLLLWAATVLSTAHSGFCIKKYSTAGSPSLSGEKPRLE